MPYCGAVSPAANDPASRPSVIGDTKKFRRGSRWFEGAFRLPEPRLGYCAATPDLALKPGIDAYELIFIVDRTLNCELGLGR